MLPESATRVLLACATAKDGEITRALLASEGLSCVACENLHTLAGEIDAGVGAILLTEEAFAAVALPELVAKFEAQPSWSDIPVVMLMRSDRNSDETSRILALLRNVTLLERPAPMRSVVSAVQAAVRGRERQYQIRDQFKTIREVQEQFEAMANFIPHLAWMARPDGWIFWYNQRWYDYTGTTAEQMQGWGWQSVHDPATLDKVISRWQASIQSGELFDMTFPLKRADGVFRPFWTRVIPFRDETGNIILWFGTNTDVTEQKRMIEEREELLASERTARADAEQAGRLKDEFLATLSHELRTPLNAILGWSQLLRRLNIPNDELDEGLSVIERNSRMQAQLIEDLLDMSRIVSGKLRLDVKQVDVADVIHSAIESVTPAAAAKGIRLEKILGTRGGPIWGDASRLQQVVWNLLSNAIKFTPKDGKVQVAVQQVESHLEISVADTGLGIKPEFLPYVFDRFRQADASMTRKHGGLGLGLAIVKNLVELHGGRVHVRSRGEGQGAKFVVELPTMAVHPRERISRDCQSPKQEPESVSRFHCEDDVLQGITVLVVDDQEDARNLVARVLSECKAKVAVASSAAEAREILVKVRPTVVVSDIGMPNEDGYEFIREVRRLPEHQGGRTPAAALTAFARSEDRTRALLAGYQTHISKPVEPSELVAVVASLAGKTASDAK